MLSIRANVLCKYFRTSLPVKNFYSTFSVAYALVHAISLLERKKRENLSSEGMKIDFFFSAPPQISQAFKPWERKKNPGDVPIPNYESAVSMSEIRH